MTSTNANGETLEKDLRAWARRELHPIAAVGPDASLADLEPLRRMIGDATVVAFGEGLHGGAEPLEFRNCLFRFLVEEMDFSAIAIESGIVEGYAVNAYVQGGPGDLETVVGKGFHPGFHDLVQSTDLVRWMRAYNADAAHRRKVGFFGSILPGSDGECGRSVAIEAALGYIADADAAAAAALHSRTDDLLGKLNLDRFNTDGPDQYTKLSHADRDRMTAAIADTITWFKIQKAAYTTTGADGTFELACRSAVVAGQLDEYLRQVPPGWTPKAGPATLFGTVAVSDRAEADNVRWVHEQQGADARILVFAHRGHTATAPSSIRFAAEEASHLLPAPMGMYLKRWYGAKLVTIGNLVGHDISRGGERGPPARPGSYEGLLSTLDAPFFLLDQRTAPAEVAAWLQQPHELYGLGYANALSPAQAFDIAFFSQLVTPAARHRP